MGVTGTQKFFFTVFALIIPFFSLLLYLFITGGRDCKPDIVDYAWLMIKNEGFVLLEAVLGIYVVAIMGFVFASKITKNSISGSLLGLAVIILWAYDGWMIKIMAGNFPRCPDSRFDMIDTWQAVDGGVGLNVIEIIVGAGIVVFGAIFLANKFAWIASKSKRN